jgi:hypothetical protein
MISGYNHNINKDCVHRVSSVGISTRFPAGQPRSLGSIPGRFSSPHRPDASGGPHNVYKSKHDYIHLLGHAYTEVLITL